jgi:capsular polysaccharide biosynthesis protein
MIFAFVVSKFFMDPVYEARTVVAPATLNSVNGSSLTYVVNAENSLQWQLPQVSIDNFNALLTSNSVITRSRQVLNLDQSIATIRSRVAINYTKETNTTEIVVSGTDPQENSELANVLVTQTISYVEELNQQSMTTMMKNLEGQLNQADADLDEALNKPQENYINEARRERDIERREQMVDLLSGKMMELELLQSFMTDQDQIIILSPATPPKNPVAPRVMLNTAVAAVLGFMLIVFAVFIIEYMRSTPNKDKSAT